MFPIVGGCWLVSYQCYSRPVVNASMPVGIGEKMLVSVVGIAVNSFNTYPLWLEKTLKVRQGWS